VSLILEALKKLEREKQAPDRGFLVMAQVPWAGEGRRGKALLMGGVLVAVVAVGLLARWLVRSPASPAAIEAAAAPSVAPAAPTIEPLPTSPPLRTAGPAEVVPPPTRYVPPAPKAAFPASPRAAEPTSVSPRVVPPPPLAERAKPAAESPAALRLEAISEQDGVAVAVINGQLVREGDHIGGALVVRIGVQEVELEADGRRSVLKF
jgi:hypothetical protein